MEKEGRTTRGGARRGAASVVGKHPQPVAAFSQIFLTLITQQSRIMFGFCLGAADDFPGR